MAEIYPRAHSKWMAKLGIQAQAYLSLRLMLMTSLSHPMPSRWDLAEVLVLSRQL